MSDETKPLLSRQDTLKHAAGAHLKTPTLEKQKTFMSVPDTFHGYLDLHEHDEADMEGKFKETAPSPLEEACKLCGFDLTEAISPTLEDVLGEYVVNSVGCCGPSYCVKGWTVDEDDVVPAGEMKDHLVSCCSAPAHALGDGKVVMHLLLRKSKCVFQRSLLAALISLIAGDVVYVFTISENGIVRFHLSPETGTFVKICFAYADSESVIGFFKNIKHAVTNGCFCLGVYYKEKGGQNRTVLMRYNRWKADLAPYWAAVVSKIASAA